MTIWIASTNRNNWEIIKNKNLWGVPKRNKNSIERSKPGDKILIFVRQEKVGDAILPSAITTAFEISSKPFEDETEVFKKPVTMLGEEVFPYRVKLKLIKIFKEEFDFKTLISNLEFITNKKQWTGHLRTAMRTILEEDYEYMLKAAETPRG
ncbi:EVE domain-containing protein [Methanogenium organophilum]|uniref:EVE domain-containing protein n=1 Tax=Methanogenium organophilum TaxID=2199 RepID=A0A9X9S430_METOG|nr:EVE domain-containing protein [Methanogenium organophilum]WAI01367.1 EVE domain-containing protein [Methanogenium organophilum]